MTVWVKRLSTISGRVDALGAPGPIGQNLWFATELAVMAPWWGLELPLVRRQRDTLLAEERTAEWSACWERLTRLLHEFPPASRFDGPEDLALLVSRLSAEEAERTGDVEKAARLRDAVNRLAADSQSVIVLPNGDGPRPTIDVGLIHRFAALLEQGDAAAEAGSPACVEHYQHALELSGSAGWHDPRVAEAELKMARAYLNVDSLYDPATYERYARQALASAEPFAKMVADDLIARCKLSVGTAMVEQMKQHAPSPERADEARGHLLFAATSASSEAATRASARVSLGNLAWATDDLPAAIDSYLLASTEFSDAGATRNAAVAASNAARALRAAGREDDARAVARRAVEMVAGSPQTADRLRRMLEGLLD